MCEQVARAVQEVFVRCGGRGFPVVALDCLAPAGLADVNLTPDKRQVLLHHETALLHLIQVTTAPRDGVTAFNRLLHHDAVGLLKLRSSLTFDITKEGSAMLRPLRFQRCRL